MERRKTIQERGRADAERSRLGRLVFAPVAAGIVVVRAARAEAQQPPAAASIERATGRDVAMKAS